MAQPCPQKGMDSQAPLYNPGYPQQQAYPAPGEAPPAYSQQYPSPGYLPQSGYPPSGSQQHGYLPPLTGYSQAPSGYPQPQAGYAPVPQQQGYSQPQPVPVQVVQVAAMRFGESPVSMNCPHCQAAIITGTEYVSGTASWLGCLACCGIGLMMGGITWLGCCLIPFCISACQDVEHRCPNCRRILGKMSRI